MKHFLLAHLVRNDEPQPIAFVDCGEREPEAGVAGGCLDDRAARRKLALVLRGFDHPQADAIFDRAARILRFQLRVELAASCIELFQADERRVADQVKDVGVAAHRW